MVSGNDCKYCNVFESQKTVFLRFQNSHIAQIMRLVLLWSCFKEAGIQFKCNNCILSCPLSAGGKGLKIFKVVKYTMGEDGWGGGGQGLTLLEFLERG